ncbi:fibronectin type III domain-containing protein [Aeoliella sp. SH292]|uniref:fibronectin type III domain-containing protein n=1 Tax=Aeoliella sp. SH292 TaxID=3454464 RepID=UPI003F956D96
MSKQVLRKTSVGALCLFVATAAFAAAADTVPRHVRAIWHTDPATSAIVSWTTTDPGKKSQVKLRAEGADDWTTVECQQNDKFDGKLPDGKPVPHFHHTTLTSLKPNTTYRLVCDTDGQASREFTFVTAFAEDQPFAILFGGDSRSGTDTRKDMNRMMARMVEEQTAAGRPDIVALAHGGDYIADGKELVQWLEWLDNHELTTTRDGRLLPIIPTRGNHDGGPIFNQVFAFPDRDENYYAINLGPEVRIATLNTEISTGGDQQEWLADELAAERWQHRWYLAQYHKPAFPAVKIPSGALSHWVPLFEEYQLDLACEADGHNIKRTPPIRNMQVDSAGVVYIGEGGLGVGQRTPKTNRWYLRDTAEHCSAQHHVHLLVFHKDRMDCRVVLQGGKVFDEFTRPVRPRPDSANDEKRVTN